MSLSPSEEMSANSGSGLPAYEVSRVSDAAPPLWPGHAPLLASKLWPALK